VDPFVLLILLGMAENHQFLKIVLDLGLDVARLTNAIYWIKVIHCIEFICWMDLSGG